MRYFFDTLVAGLFFLLALNVWAGDQVTATGIPIDTPWKEQVYAFAVKNVVHPSWGLAHSERDYQVARQIAKMEGIAIDEDALFACSFLHDVGGIPPFYREGVDHAVRSVEVIEPLMPGWGFPMAKWPQVKEMILGHTYYGPKPTTDQAKAFRDADVLDFLGSIGIARILAVTEEPGRSSSVLKPSLDTLVDFEKTMASNCMLSSCRILAIPRQKELDVFLNAIHVESLLSKAL